MASLETTVAGLLLELTLEEKVSLLAGADMWHTQEIARLGIGSIKVRWKAPPAHCQHHEYDTLITSPDDRWPFRRPRQVRRRRDKGGFRARPRLSGGDVVQAADEGLGPPALQRGHHKVGPCASRAHHLLCEEPAGRAQL